ncbi:hypothetical protein COO60DRAFT_903154 [Scenedesmus sp. NREL 46B-D3]|nr:hypothetical protein COO60DRAFT_903154 [Scenedesmus sp. NREL 46B-D3]
MLLGGPGWLAHFPVAELLLHEPATCVACSAPVCLLLPACSTFGLAVLAADPDEPGEEPELVAALTAQAEQQQQQQQQAGGDLVLLSLVVRADVRRQGVGEMLLRALLLHAVRLQACGQPCARLVADVALNNRRAWQFFEAMGFTRGDASGQTAEAWLSLPTEAGERHAPRASTLPPAAATAALASRNPAGNRSNRSSAGCCAITVMPPVRRPGVQHVPRPAVLHKGLHQAVSKTTAMRSVCGA